MSNIKENEPMKYQERKALGLILDASDRREAEEIAAMIKARTFETMHDNGWERADRTPALSAAVHNIVMGGTFDDGGSCHVTPGERLEQFYRYGEMTPPLPRGGKIWVRPAVPHVCEDCENEFSDESAAEDHVENSPYCRGPIRRIKAVLAVAVVLACVAMAGCQRVAPAVEAQAVSTSEAAPSPAKAVHYCAGKDKDGSRCKRHVKNEGDYCWMHREQANPCWRPKGSKPKEDCYYKDGDTTQPIDGRP